MKDCETTLMSHYGKVRPSTPAPHPLDKKRETTLPLIRTLRRTRQNLPFCG